MIQDIFSTARTGNQSAQVQAHERAALQSSWHIPSHNALSKSLRNRSFAHARLSDEHRVVLAAARENLDASPHLVIATDHGVQESVPCRLSQIARVFFERLIL
jgi:hypothetical protein